MLCSIRYSLQASNSNLLPSPISSESLVWPSFMRDISCSIFLAVNFPSYGLWSKTASKIKGKITIQTKHRYNTQITLSQPKLTTNLTTYFKTYLFYLKSIRLLITYFSFLFLALSQALFPQTELAEHSPCLSSFVQLP